MAGSPRLETGLMDGLFIAHPTSSPNQYTIDQPRFQDNTIELMVYCSHLPKLGNASFEELAGSFEPIRNGEIF